MNPKVFMVLRILLGVFILFFGLNKFFQFMPFGEMPEEVMNYMGALSSTKTLPYLVGIVEVAAGLAFIFNKFGALMAIILMSVSINAVLFHAFLAQDSIPGALILLVLNIAVLFGYKDKYAALLS